MVVLALDTTSRQGSSAVAVDGRVALEIASDASVPQAARVPRELQTLLMRAGLTLQSVDAFAVAVGPGSFTGLRVGIATMQGLAFDTDKPLVGVSALDALAMLASEFEDQRSPGPVPGPPGPKGPGLHEGRPGLQECEPGLRVLTATWIDAWRGEVYAALYDGITAIEEVTVERPQDILQRWSSADEQTGGPKSRMYRFIGDGVVSHVTAIREAVGGQAHMASALTPSLAGAIARHATTALASGHRPAADEIRPLYVRRPDAEIARDARVTR